MTGRLSKNADAVGQRFDRRRRWLLLTLIAILPVRVVGKHKLSKEQCARINGQMKKLQSRMRQAHTSKQGRRYRQKMRDLQLKHYRGC